jgi:DNA repair exonuclease SbcCD ATPase subunit
MHIKNVAIEAFLTYEKLEMAELKLDKGCNLILGKNGSGKSSFLQAIIFALSDKFKSMNK